MSPPDSAKNQARKLLRTLCNFMLPLIQGTGGQTMDAKEIHFGLDSIEADEFVTELEKFISGMISRSRQQSQDIAIEATWEKLRVEKDWLDNFEETDWLWEVAVPDDETTIGAVSSGEANPEQISANNSMILHHPTPQLMALSSYDKELHIHLQGFRKHVTQNMPIRLLGFEPHNGKLKISLLERAEVYNYLAPKIRADYDDRRDRIRFEYGHNIFKWNMKFVQYAILSHTWNQTPGELTYGDWQNGSLDETHPKCQKLINFCKTAWEDHGLTLGWIDTVCINKESSAELDESIRSMYRWYSSADVCITYLASTNTVSKMYADPWFTRGWTLQELVAPHCIKFYNKDWNKLSNKSNDKCNPIIQKKIERATTITDDELLSFQQLWRPTLSISRKMQLAAKRQVTREEDIAYCLMGIFGVSISTAYGEGGDRAFFRLVEEIFRSTKDGSDIFNWAGDHNHSRQQPTSLFPSHPSDYLNRQKFRPWRPIEPLTFTHLGLRTPILLMCAVPICGSVSEDVHQPIGDYHATVFIAPFNDCNGLEVSKSYHLLDERFNGPEGLQKAFMKWKLLHPWQKNKTSNLTFGILNVEEQGTSICIRKTCLAVLLQLTKEYRIDNRVQTRKSDSDYDRIYTEKPIVFDLQKTKNDSDNKNKDYYELERGELAKHGMKLETLYL